MENFSPAETECEDGPEQLFFIFIVIRMHVICMGSRNSRVYEFSAQTEISCRLHGEFQPNQPG